MSKVGATPAIRIAVIGATLLLAACGSRGPDTKLADLDKQIAGDDVDPALTSALQDQIIVDPALTQQSNKLAVRATPEPVQAQYPPPGGERRMRTSGQPGARSSAINASATDAQGDCSASFASFDHDPRWAQRLPAAFPVFPGGRVTEAAGNDKGGCKLRMANFVTSAQPREILDWYGARAAGAGYSVEHQIRGSDQILAGTRPNDDGAYYLVVTPRADGSAEVALLANQGV